MNRDRISEVHLGVHIGENFFFRKGERQGEIEREIEGGCKYCRQSVEGGGSRWGEGGVLGRNMSRFGDRSIQCSTDFSRRGYM